MKPYDDLPKAEFGFPGPLRDRLVAAILSGAKTTTTGLLQDYENCGEAPPRAGTREVVVDSADRPVAVLEYTDVRVLPLAEVDAVHARDEGEGDRTVGRWRATHEAFWQSAGMREALGDPEFTVTDDTKVVAQRFRVLARLDGEAS